MSGLFPGSATKEQFWDNLMQEKDLTNIADSNDFGVSPATFFEDKKGVVDKCYSLRGGYIRGFDFDPSGYQLDADYLAKQDKLYQWSLHVAKDALMDSGYYNNSEVLAKCGLILGNLSFPTSSSHQLLADMYTQTTEQALQELLQDKNFKIKASKKPLPDNEVLMPTPSDLVSQALGIQGGHYALDAACATSLYAIKLACDELLTGKTDLMLAGAVCASDQLFIHMGFSIFHAYAPHDEKFAPLDAKSGGLVSAEGAGMVVLKRYDEALRDGDTILGIIGGIGLSNDGRGKFLLSPNPKGQKLAFERAYNLHDIVPQNTSYLECHATGTPLGDMTELNSISDFFEPYQNKPLLGSVKSNMGHLLTAAGMTGLLKVLIAMQKGTIPPNINLTKAVQTNNQWIQDAQIITEQTPWSGNQAGINSFGFGGTNAHMVVQKEVAKPTEVFTPIPLAPMSIIGMAAHFGSCTNLDDFYAAIHNGEQLFTPLPTRRWKGFENNKNLLQKYGLEAAPEGAYISDFEIDLLRYKIQPKEAETLEPQQALILKVADKALQDAQLAESKNVAVLIAMESELAIHHYLARWDSSWQLEAALLESGIQLDESQQKTLLEQSKNALYFREGSQTPSQHTSFVGNIMASRIAALWDFSGPAFTVSCGDDSVFKALEVAQNLLALGEVEAVVVGGVDLAGGLEHVLLKSQKNQLHTNPISSLSLEQNNTGWKVGEGAGAIVLQRQKDNQKEQKIYATVQPISNKDLAKQGATIGYQELVANGNMEEEQQEEKQLLDTTLLPTTARALGSIKTTIGHTGAASGIAALIKTALCVYHQFIPAIPNWKQPENKAFEGKKYYFPTDSAPWILEQGQTKRTALVNTGMSTNWLVEQADKTSAKSKKTPLQKGRLGSLLIVQGNNQKELELQLAALEMALQSSQTLTTIAALFHQKYKTATADFCLVILAKNKTIAQQEITFFNRSLTTAFEQNKTIRTPKGSYFTALPQGKKGKVAFVYPGSAAAYRGLGKDLFQLFPDLQNHFENILPDGLQAFLGTDYIYPKTINATDEVAPIQSDTISMMSTGVLFATAYTHLARQYFGLQPNSAFGYSMGECSSMYYALGLWSAEETEVFRHSPIFQTEFAGDLRALAKHWNISTDEAKERWTSLILLADAKQVKTMVATKDKVYLTFVNTANEVIISGDKAACQQIVQQLKCKSIEVPFQNVIHHDFCTVERQGLLDMHTFPLQEQSAIDFYSSLTLNKLPIDSQAIGENSTKVCYQAVDFPKVVDKMYSDEHRIFVELGANATCTTWIKTILKDRPHLAVSFNQKGKSDGICLLEAFAQLVSHGVELDLSSLFEDITIKKAKIRTFQKKIELGGANIYDVLSTPALLEQFATIKRDKKQPALALAGGDNMPNRIKNIRKNTVLPTNTVTMEIPILSTNNQTTAPSSTTKKVGENGLLLQDYTDNQHLKDKKIIFTQEDLAEFATGQIAKVFGEEYGIIDTYRRRVMLPMDPYLLVSRVTDLKGKRGVFEPSFMQTEYDIPYNAWYTTDGQIPWAVSVESGQCDLLLISYLGIDFENKGNLVYRLLDCTLTFVDDLPFEGQTLRYDISINSFVRNGENLLFFFSYDCYVQDRLVLKMRGGCAGFFQDDQLQDGNGVVYSADELKAKQNAKKPQFTPLLETKKRSFDKQDLQHLINGEAEKCFGDISYFANGRNPSLCLPPEKILMLDRITSVDLQGGSFGLGLVIAEKDLTPDAWFFPCHFRDDEVLAGSLQAEGGGNLLRFFMLMLGLQRLTKDARYQPIFDLPQKVRCRKQVTPTKDTKLIYKLEVKEIGLVPNPYVIADLEIISDGIITVHFENLGLQLREKDNPKYLEEKEGKKGVAISPRSQGALLNEKDITNFALDNLSKAFGEDFACYDGRKVSRQPNTDLQLISRVLRVEGERGYFKKPSTIYAEYDVPQDAWYYEQNSYRTMPYSVLMEIALQPCGLLGAYMGSTLKYSDKDLYFRNLDGTGEMFDLPAGTDFRGKVISNKAVLVSSVSLAGTVLQNYTFECSVDGHIFYKGGSSFGFFPAEALAQQVGLDNGKAVAAWYQAQNLQAKDYMQIKLDSLYGKMKLFKAPVNKPHYKLSADQLLLLDDLKIVKDGGEHGKGYVHATRKVRTYDWFFTCHFYQDPVMPGSLGVEAILQAMQTFVLQQDLAKDFKNPAFVQLPNHETKWKYRGQILQPAEYLHCEAHFKSIELKDGTLQLIADAYLWNGDTRIYQVTDLALGVMEAK